MNTKKRLVASLLAMAMCFTMLIGSTFAWFTDTASTSVNKIESGTLKIGMYADVACTDSVENKTLSFIKAGENVLWEPGSEWKLPTVYLKNEGSLAAKYKVQITGINGDAELNKVIDWTISTGDGHLGAGEAEEITISGKMQETAGNEYQGLTIDGIAISVVATQDTVENDSFNNTYDANAEYPLYPNERRATTDEELAEILANLNGVDTIYLTEGTFNAFNAEGKNVTLIGAVDENGDPATTIYTATAPINNDSAGVWEWCKNVAFENIIFEAAEGIETANSTYQNSLNMENGVSVTFTNCKFVNQGVHISGDATFTNCEFEGNNTGYRGIAFIPNYNSVCTWVVDGCTFSGYTDVAINVQDGGKSDLTIKNSDVSSKIEVGALKSLTVENSDLNCEVIVWFNATSVTIPTDCEGTGYIFTNHGY